MLGISLSYVSNETVAGWDALLAKFKSGGVTDIFYNVLASGAHYNSAIYPQSNAMKSGFDSLAYIIVAAHALGMRVHAWLSFGAYIPYMDSALAISGGGFADFSNAAAREAMRSIVAEIVAKYPRLDGAIFDYMRFPSMNDSTYYSEDDVTRALEGCVNEIPVSMDIFTSVKPYYDNPTEWGQRWDLWYASGLVDYIVPMCYSPFYYNNFERSIAWWTETAGVPRSVIVPKLSVIDTHSENEASYKSDAVLATELVWWQQFGFSHLAIFDQRATVEQMAAIAALLPNEGGNEMGIYDTLIAQADALAAAGEDLLERAEVIRNQALALQPADAAADTAVTEAQEALNAAQALADTF